MKSKILMAFFIITIALSRLISIFNITAQELPSIVFTEIMYDLEGSDADREWVEIYNRGSQVIEIIGGTGEGSWRFNDGSNHTLNLFQGDLIIDPLETAILTSNAEVFLQDHPNFSGTVIDTVMNLNNTADIISLSSDAGQTFFTTVSYQSSWGANGNGYTLEKIDPVAGDEQSNWQQSAILGGSPGSVSTTTPPPPPPPPGENHPPIAEAGDDQTITLGEIASFDASNSYDEDGDLLTYSWDFGDSQTASGVTTTHQYLSAESYIVTLIVSDGEFSDQDTLTMEVIDNSPVPGPSSNSGPSPTNYSYQIVINEIFPNPAGSDNEEEFIELRNLSYETADLSGWQLQDNSSTVYTISAADFTSTEIAPGGYFVVTRPISHLALNNSNGDQVILYQPNGNQLVMIQYSSSALEGKSYARTVTGDWSWTATVTPGAENLFSSNLPPEAKIQLTGSQFFLDEEIEFDGSLSTDPDSSELSYHWDFGDSNFADEAKETHLYENSGTFTVVLTVTDNNNLTDSVTKQISILPLPLLATSTSTSTPADITQYQQLAISEFLANPQGSDNEEWIELYNDSSQNIDLSSLQLDDAEGGSQPFVLSQLSIQPLEYLVIPRSTSKIALNNSADAVRLLTVSGQIIQEVEYTNALEGSSYSYQPMLNSWFWTEVPTPGAENNVSGFGTFSIAAMANDDNQAIYQISEIKELAKGLIVKTQGIVTVPPGLFSKHSFYLAEVDLANKEAIILEGIEVYSSQLDFSTLQLGDIVELEGKVSELKNKKRINLTNPAKAGQINIIDHWELPQSDLIATGEVDEAFIDSLIMVSGALLEKKGRSYFIDDGSGEIKVFLKDSAQIILPEIEEGMIMTVTGILDITNSGYRLLPRFNEDLNVGQILGESELASVTSEVIDVPADHKKEKVIKILLIGGGGLLAVIIGLLVKMKLLKG